MRATGGKIVSCSSPGCCVANANRVHGRPTFFKYAGKRMVDVPPDHSGPAFCSIECAAVAILVRDGVWEEPEAPLVAASPD